MPTFSHGSKGRIHLNGTDLSPYVNQVATNAVLDTADTSALAGTYKTFVIGQGSAQVNASGMHDDTAGAIIDVLEAAKSDAASEITHWPSLDTVGNFGVAMQAVETALNVQTPVAGVAAVTMAAESTTGFERVVALTAAADQFTSGTTNGATVDGLAASSAGAAGYLHTFTYGGAGDVTVKIQHSTTGTGGWADLITFSTVATDHHSERATIAGTINRYLRAVVIKTGAGTATVSASLSRTPNL